MLSKFDDNNFNYEADLIQNYERQLKNRNKEFSKCDEEFSEIKERTEIVQAYYYSPKERKASNDTLSMNGSQAETLSQTSESSFFLSFTNSNKSQLNSSKENIQVENKQNVDVPYYFGLEEYYQKIMPEKFTEYKKTKNYLPKYSKTIKNEESFNTLEQSKSKEMSQNSIQFQYRNYFPFPYYGIFYQVNPLMFNQFSKAFISNKFNKNKNKNIIKNKTDDDKTIKEDKKEDQKENKTDDKKDDKKDNKNEEKNDQIEKKVQKQQKQYSKNTNKTQHISNKNNYKRNADREYNNQRNSNYNNYNGQYKKNYKKNYNYKYNHYNYYDYNDNYQNERSFYNNNYHKRRNHNMYENEF